MPLGGGSGNVGNQRATIGEDTGTKPKNVKGKDVGYSAVIGVGILDYDPHTHIISTGKSPAAYRGKA